MIGQELIVSVDDAFKGCRPFNNSFQLSASKNSKNVEPSLWDSIIRIFRPSIYIQLINWSYISDVTLVKVEGDCAHIQLGWFELDPSMSCMSNDVEYREELCLPPFIKSIHFRVVRSSVVPKGKTPCILKSFQATP
jgi:hypothetical protein